MTPGRKPSTTTSAFFASRRNTSHPFGFFSSSRMPRLLRLARRKNTEVPSCRGPISRAGTSVFFRLANRNKRGMRLELKNPKGCEVFLRLAKKADVVVEGFRPGVMTRLGLGYDALAAVNPRLVCCSIPGYGQDGPYAGRAGHHIQCIC